MHARSIDVGHGNTKYTTSSNTNAGFNCDLFPSIAPPAAKDLQITGGVFSAADTVNIQIEDAIYTVGKDAHGHGTKRIIDKSFPTTNTYLALIRGALCFMKCPRIDFLVLGLPLNTFDLHRDYLRQALKGRHEVTIPSRNRKGSSAEKMIFDIGNVHVLPQPVGAFYNYYIPKKQLQEKEGQRNMVIDVGHGTLDWFVSDGLKPDYSRSGADFTGMGTVIKAVADAIHDRAGANYNVLADIDKSIRTGSCFQYMQKAINAREDFKSVISGAVRNAVSGMLGAVGDIGDIHNIIVTGGGAPVYLEELRKALPDIELLVDDDGIYSNVRGFQMFGESAISQPNKRAA